MIAPTSPAASAPSLTAADLAAAVATVPPSPDWAACVGACRTLDALAAQIPDALRVRVRDSGLGTAAGARDDRTVVPGHGLAGMRERTAMLGGEITVGPLTEGGFAVAATLPREPVP